MTATNPLWDEFCDRLREAGNHLVSESAPQTPLEQAEGVRYLLRLLRYTTINEIEYADPLWPTFASALDPNMKCKIGADNPDNIYTRARISGKYRYRVSGKRGTVPLLTFGSRAARYHIDGTMAPTGNLHGHDLTLDDEGRFSFIISVDKPESGDWLPMSEDTTIISVRQSFQNRKEEVPAELHIELLDEDVPVEPLDPEVFTAQVRQAVQNVTGTAKTFAEWTRLFMTRPNELPDWGQEIFQKAGGDPTIYYFHGYWKLADDEAWVIETEIPDCEYWNFVLQNWWMESLDYDRANIYINNHTAKLNDDGTVTIVVSAKDPGFGNWISTESHPEGTAVLRWVKTQGHPEPRCKVIKI